MGTKVQDVCQVCGKQLSGGNMVFCSDDRCYQLFMEWRDLGKITDDRPSLHEYYLKKESVVQNAQWVVK